MKSGLETKQTTHESNERKQYFEHTGQQKARTMQSESGWIPVDKIKENGEGREGGVGMKYGIDWVKKRRAGVSGLACGCRRWRLMRPVVLNDRATSPGQDSRTLSTHGALIKEGEGHDLESDRVCRGEQDSGPTI